MIDTYNFIVRNSGSRENTYYIDYVGRYTIEEVSKATQVEEQKLRGIYEQNGGTLDEGLGLYYFDNVISAKKTISDIFAAMKKKNKGRVVTLTGQEIEYIRKALINDGSGNIGINAKLKDAIFKKLNG